MVRRATGPGFRRRSKRTRARASTWSHGDMRSRSRSRTDSLGSSTKSLGSKDTDAAAQMPDDSQSVKAQLESLTFFTSPFKVAYYSALYLQQRLRNTAGYIVQYPRTLAYSAALGSIYTALHFIAGPHVEVFQQIDAWVAWHSYWVMLGVLSSIGLGAGLHTFVLFLGPHIARVTLTAYECGNTSFAVNGPAAFQCSPHAAVASVAFARILRKVISESLCWGAGTAIGELPPYFIARAASATGQGDGEYERLKQRAASGGSLPLKDRALLNIYELLRRFGFSGILLFAAIPNPLFDLAGITCGHFQVPFWTFFGATFLGKSFVKSTIQSTVVITAFSKEMIAMVLAFLRNVSPWAHDLAEHVLHQQAVAFGNGHGASSSDSQSDDGDSSVSLIGSVWNTCVAIMLIYFVVSTLETFAQSHLAEVKSWGQNQLARVGSRQKTVVVDDDSE